ncbi:unnamed protein product [Brassica napus]|uniref:(rape) hypothetical protein n=1 Tax=Brassica napus TaxID=3708 RepID=A0A816K4B7_BRANA|nr:unnamed protein product [Brassica napus]
MGASYQECSSLLLQDLKVAIKESYLIFPSEETLTHERKPMFLSNVDQVLNFDVQTVHFFRPNKDYPPEIVSEMLRKAMVRAMDAYDLLAGRLRLNPSSGRLNVDCNGAGAGFVMAESEYTLEELGDLVYPNPAFVELVTSQLQSLPKDDQPLFAFQVTSFKCGGFAMGISTNHTTFDGLSFKTFLDNLASLLSDKPSSTPPCNDQKASESVSSVCVRVTGFNVVTVLVWRCKALSLVEEEEVDDLEKNQPFFTRWTSEGGWILSFPLRIHGNAVLTGARKGVNERHCSKNCLGRSWKW